MGYIKHNTIVCTGYEPDLQDAYKKAVELFGWKMVTKVSKRMSNSYRTFTIFGKAYKLIKPKKIFGFAVIPDGSKEGWETSNDNDEKREEFFEWLEKKERMIKAVDVIFGGDDPDVRVEAHYSGED